MIIEVDLLSLPTEIEMAEMRAYGMAVAKHIEQRVMVRREPELDKQGFLSPSVKGYRRQAKKWRTGWDFPGGVKLNLPKQKHLKKKKRIKPFLVRQAIYLMTKD